MLRIRHLLSGSALAVCALSGAQAQSVHPQQPQPGYVNPFAPLTDADQLAAQLRTLAASPTDLYALLNAAKLSLKVGDIDAAAALYTRAAQVSPQHPQVKAGMARLLVQAGRPGQALRRFAEAQALGATLADVGSDLALAYDLVGEQQRAQREYRALLRLGADDEATRRYALSLGISGLKEPALALLEPLNRQSDRGAWRARAFVLAMTGDRRGAEQIATTMMPPGMAQGLAPFFDRLPRLSAAERAFAVNFGEVRASPTRLADARLVPPLPALSPEPNPFPPVRATPVQVAARDEDGGKKKRKKSKKDKSEPVRLAAAQPYVAPLPPPPAPTAIQLAGLSSSRMPATFGRYGTAGGRVRVLPPPADAYRTPVARAASAVETDGDEPDFAVNAVSALAAGTTPATTLAAAEPIRTRAPAPVVVQAQPPAAAPPQVLTFAGVPSAQVSTFSLAGPAPAPAAAATPAPGFGASVAVATPAVIQPAAPPPVMVAAITPATGAPPPPKGATGDAVLAAIVAGIKVPDAELAARPAALPPAGSVRPKLLANVEKKAEAEKARVEPVDAKVKGEPKGKALVDKTDAKTRDSKGKAVDVKLADAKGAKAKAAELKLADAKGAKGKDAREKPDAKKPDKAEPQRYWVQVAGGANEDTLGKAWKQVAGSAASLKGKSGYTTPLRATNRVLTGPYKSSAEAMAAVNQLKKEGVSAFMFTSEPGQKVTRLGGK